MCLIRLLCDHKTFNLSILLTNVAIQNALKHKKKILRQDIEVDTSRAATISWSTEI